MNSVLYKQVYFYLVYFTSSKDPLLQFGESEPSPSGPSGIAGTERLLLFDIVQLLDLFIGEVDDLRVRDDTLGSDGLRQHCI